MLMERIDGTDYEVGTPQHAMARAAHQARWDAMYFQAHHREYERNLRLIRDWDRLKDELRSDANASAFLARELLFVRPTVERTIYEALKAAEFIPVEGGHPRGADSYSTQLMNGTGEAKVSHDLAGDSPRVDVDKIEDLRKYVNARASYAYSVQDLEHAAFARTPLPQWKAMECADAIARKLDFIGRSGDGLTGLKGFFNSSLVPVKTLTNGEWTSSGTPDEIVADFNEIEQTIIDNTKDTARPGYTLVVPTTVEGRLVTLQKSTGVDLNLLQWLLKNARLITSIKRWIALDSAVSPDVAAADPPQGVCYRPDPLQLFWPIPIGYEEQPPQLKGWEWIVEARARCGGVDFRRPKEALYIENFD